MTHSTVAREDARMMFEKPTAEEIAPGVRLDKIQPGGRYGPNRETQMHTLGGQVWSDSWVLGDESDAFQLRIPDVRMPANQYYPLHYHGCWIAVIVLDGTVLIGDWWMKPGDVLVAAGGLEYGPVLNGPDGCQLFEIFAKDHLAIGGYAREYHDHPTLTVLEIPSVFEERSPINKRNDGRQVLPNANVEGLTTGTLDDVRVWDLGEPGDPDRGAFKGVNLAPGEAKPGRTYEDAYAIFILEGEMSLGGRRLAKHDVLLIERGAKVEALTAGPAGAQLLEVARTVRGLEPQHG